MNKALALLALPLATLTLSACDTYGYGDYGYNGYGGYGGYGGGYYDDYYGGYPYTYDGFYDGYYGPIYDGYWGTNGFFYYRQNDRDRYYRQGDRNHFYRGNQAPGTGWRSMNGTTYPRQGYQMPNYPGAGSNGRTWQQGTTTTPGTTTQPGTTWQGRTWHRRY